MLAFASPLLFFSIFSSPILAVQNRDLGLSTPASALPGAAPRAPEAGGSSLMLSEALPMMPPGDLTAAGTPTCETTVTQPFLLASWTGSVAATKHAVAHAVGAVDHAVDLAVRYAVLYPKIAADAWLALRIISIMTLAIVIFDEVRVLLAREAPALETPPEPGPAAPAKRITAYKPARPAVWAGPGTEKLQNHLISLCFGAFRGRN